MRFAGLVLLLVGCGGGTAQTVADAYEGGGAAGETAVVTNPTSGKGGSTHSLAGEGGSGVIAIGGEAGADGGEPSAGGSPVGGAPVEGGGAGGDGGSAGGDGGGFAGTGGGSTEPDINECVAQATSCDGLCGGADQCKTCRPFSDFSGYLTLGGDDNPTNQERSCCQGEMTVGLPVKPMECTKFTVQPGAYAEFSEHSCAAEARVPQCLVVSGLVGGVGTERTVYVSRPSQNAWIRAQVTNLVGGECPLRCN